jgi:hypothetical protein
VARVRVHPSVILVPHDRVVSTADPFLPVPDPGAEPAAGVLPADDRTELDRTDEESGIDRDAPEMKPVARSARFKPPAPGDALDEDGLRLDLGID